MTLLLDCNSMLLPLIFIRTYLCIECKQSQSYTDSLDTSKHIVHRRQISKVKSVHTAVIPIAMQTASLAYVLHKTYVINT